MKRPVLQTGVYYKMGFNDEISIGMEWEVVLMDKVE